MYKLLILFVVSFNFFLFAEETDRLKIKTEKVLQYLQPETELERQIIVDKEWLLGANIPKTSRTLKKIDALYGFSLYRSKLRVISLIGMDAFRGKPDPSKPLTGENFAAMFARHFAEKYTDDEEILKILQYQYEIIIAYWNSLYYPIDDRLCGYRRGVELIQALGPSLDLYIAFVESQDDDFHQQALYWFMTQVVRSAPEAVEETPSTYKQGFVDYIKTFFGLYAPENHGEGTVGDMIIQAIKLNGGRPISISMLQDQYPDYRTKARYRRLVNVFDNLVQKKVLIKQGQGPNTTYALRES